MTKNTNSKQKMLAITIVLLILMVSSAAAYAPKVHATEPTIPEKGAFILNDVAALNISQYTVTPKQYPQYVYYGVVPEENVGYTLESDASKLNVSCTFANGKLHILHVTETEGPPSLTRTSDGALSNAKSFLGSYQSYTGKAFYGELSLMLDHVDPFKNSTTTLGNLKLTVSASGEYTTFYWMYTFNGVDARHKCVALGYKNDFLDYFVDTWDLYQIGSTAISLSEEQAIAIAMESARTYSYTVGSGDDIVEVNDFNVTRAMVTQLVFSNSIHADSPRNDDLLKLYPMWRIGVGLDKFYPGNVYGIYVDIWADSREVRHIEEAFSTLPQEFIGYGLFDESSAEQVYTHLSSEIYSHSVPIIWIAILAVVITIFGFPIWLNNKKNSLRFGGLPKLRLFKFTVGLLCILLSFMILQGPILTAEATTYRATIWGDREYNKTASEKYRQDMIASNVTSFFSGSGYSASNFQGEYTFKSNILYWIDHSEQNYDKVAVVYFDHGVGDYNPNDDDIWHYQVLDNSGTSVFDSDLYPKTDPGHTFFAFISTCMSANLTYNCPQGGGLNENNKAVGMPFAWMHCVVGSNMSSDGYTNPSGSRCYIGFPYGSASLSQTVDGVLFYDWVWAFFWFALLYGDVSVNYALDQASLMLYESSFGSTDLHNGFRPVWGDPWETADSTLVVYGNGNIHLYQGSSPPPPPPSTLKFDARVWYPEWQEWVPIDVGVYVDNQYVGSTNYMYLEIGVGLGNHTVEVDEEWFYNPFVGFWLEPDYYGNNPYEYQPITIIATQEGIYFQVAYGYPP